MSESIPKNKKIYLAGHTGLVGSAIVRVLSSGYGGIAKSQIVTRELEELDLTDQRATLEFFKQERPDVVFLAAAKVGGILANNTYPADFIYTNLAIETNVIHAAYKSGVKRLLFLGSSCIYPKECPQPMKEEYLMIGPLEPTNRPYALAKIAGIEMCWSYNRQYGTRFIPVMPTNLYGPGDNYDLTNSHVLPALIRKFHLAKMVMNGDPDGIKRDERAFGAIPSDTLEALGIKRLSDGGLTIKDHRCCVPIWGTGAPRREFLYSADLAEACVYIMNLSDQRINAVLQGGQDLAMPLINIGCGQDQTIKELAAIVKDVVGYKGEIVFDKEKPDGTMVKRLDVSLISDLGWRSKTSLEEGIVKSYEDYQLRGKINLTHSQMDAKDFQERSSIGKI
ncbi:MAG: GDP-L-fucose synthase [Deltaproteobacteria bacterium]|nr:GDP-L-fucose synthase [Deltaproteobacteria bacterium]